MIFGFLHFRTLQTYLRTMVQVILPKSLGFGTKIGNIKSWSKEMFYKMAVLWSKIANIWALKTVGSLHLSNMRSIRSGKLTLWVAPTIEKLAGHGQEQYKKRDFFPWVFLFFKKGQNLIFLLKKLKKKFYMNFTSSVFDIWKTVKSSFRFQKWLRSKWWYHCNYPFR